MVIPIVKKMFSKRSNGTSPSSGKLSRASLQSDLSVSQMYLLNNPIDEYLKKVNRYLKKELYEGLPDMIVSMEWTFGFSIPAGTFRVTGKITISQVAKQQSTILEALRFLTLGFLHSQGLLMKVALLCQTSEIDAAELEKLTKVKEKLVGFSGLLDSIIAYYLIGDIRNLPKVDDVKRVAKKLRKTIGNINPRNFPRLIPNSVVAEEDILCSFLGLHRDVADRLRSVNPVMRSHQSDLYFLQHFLADPEAKESLTEREADTSLKLQEIGFTQSRSVVIANWIAKQPSAEHWSHLVWAQHYIENLFTYDIFLNDHVCRYPYEEGNVNEWFSVSVERDGDEDAVVETEVPVINTTYPNASKFIRKKIEQNQQVQQYPRKRIYFHGTDHMSAKSILEDGINLGMGKSGCDFSSGAGFYLVNCSKYATQWALKSSAAAVLMFCVSEDSLSDYKALDLSNEREKCKEVREHFRNNVKLSSSVRKECRDCDYIKGPVSSIPRVIQQICIKKEGMAVSIGNAANICAVIFMDRQIENNFKP